MQNKDSHLKNTEKINRGVIDLDIKKLIDNLEKKYKTRNPYELAASTNVLVIFENLGSINGYYNKQLRQKQIHINCNLPEHLQLLTCAHELGHSILHQSANTPFLKSFTYLPVDKMEIEANKFAIELLLSDDMILDFQDYTLEQIARFTGYCKELIELKFR